MGSLISDAGKASLQSVFSNIHDTFSRAVNAFKDGKEVILSTNPNYSHIYKQPLGNVSKTTLERVIQARIYYFPRKAGNETLGVGGDLNPQQPIDEIRLKVLPADYQFLLTAERIIVDGALFQLASVGNPHGLFGTGFFTVYLRRVS